MKEFLLSDESLNSHGFVVLTSGINLDRFKANPVMFLNHDRNKGVVGKWENIRVDENKLFGTPVFDMEHEPGKTAGEQVEKGFLNGASIGIDHIRFSEINGMRTVVSCDLYEVSVCDIPSNQNALQLYYEGEPVTLSEMKELSLNKKNMETTNLQRIAFALSMPETATVEDICTAIKTMQEALPGNVALMMDNAVKKQIITKEEGNELLEMAANNPLSLCKFLQKREEANRKTLSASYDKFMSDNRNKFVGIRNDERLKQLALHDLDTFKRFASLFPNPVRPTDILKFSSKEKTIAEWTLDDYRKLAPQELAKDPELYRRLIKEQRNSNK